MYTIMKVNMRIVWKRSEQFDKKREIVACLLIDNSYFVVGHFINNTVMDVFHVWSLVSGK
jgi:hypothetical protein